MASPAQASASPHYTTNTGVRLSPEVKAKLTELARRYHAATGRTLLVTSGSRTPAEQARAMYNKLRLGDRLRGYRNQAAVQPLVRIYDRGKRQRWSRDRIVAAMAEQIQGQIDRGVYISRHLWEHAFDVRNFDMTARQKRAFLQAAREVGGLYVLEERRPPHFHLELR